MSNEPKPDTTGAGGGTGADRAAQDAQQAGLWLKGPARHAATIACAALIVLSLGYLLWSIQPPRILDTGARLRAQGGPISVYNLPEGGERIHMLKPGDAVKVDSSKARGARISTHLEADGATYEAFIDEKDFDADDLSRARATLQRAGF